MRNRFTPPQAPLDVVDMGGNNSGQGSGIEIPEGVRGWCWGGFFLGWIWAVGNRTWIGLVCLIPYVGFVGAICLGIWGRQLAWQNKRWDSVEHFTRVQRRWSIWGTVIVVGIAGLGILAAIVIPAYQHYALHHAAPH